jgi:hypothetical protein
MKRAWSILVVALLSGCASGGPDMGPVGGGLSVIGLAIIVAAVIRSIGGALCTKDDEKGGDEHDA